MRTLELNPIELTRLQTLVRDAITGNKRVEDLLRSRVVPRSNGIERIPPQVAFDNSASPRATLFEITAQDRPGLLFDLARSFSAADCNIEVVLIDTEGRKAIDIFYVTRRGKPLEKQAAEEVTATLREVAA